MIDASEIETKAKEFEIHTSNVQRDYVFGWVLFGLFTSSKLKDTLFLKGGNALRKGYFENTRFSSDLDFGIPGDISEKDLLDEINSVCTFIHDKAGVQFVQNENKVEEKFTATETPLPDLKVYEVRVYFKDFYGNADHIKLRISMDVTRFDKVLLDLQTVRLIHPYSDAVELACNIRCMKLEEIIATKLKCLMQRQHAPDLFDYAYSISLLGGTLNKEEVVQTFIQKTIFSRNPYILKNILLKTTFDYFKEQWVKSIVCAKQFFMNVEDAVAIFVADMDSLFSDYSDNGYAQFAYFPANLRMPIMNAARTQTVLKIRYKNEDRVVEPYSLKYLQRRDGAEREYFFVFNRSGGNNPPGIRCFVPENVQSIENTTEKFEPQYQIELSKAGEAPENPYLFDPNKPERASRRRVPRSSFRSIRNEIKYIYECNYCGKKFTRRTMDPVIRPHKDKSGCSCYGTYGIYVDTKYP
ncbi:MAG: nucleotidyl transferase AbiEii/AbiGii toxin family protein [Candidatus Paceibacterota bacterium]